jgi:hypothetical protein
MALTFLSSFKKKDVSIKLMIHQRLAGWEKARDPSTLHASDLMKGLEFCPREFALYGLTGKYPKDGFVGTAMRITYDHGKDMERRMRNDWLRDVVRGKWRCSVCGNVHNEFGAVPITKCPSCKYPNTWEYIEPNFVSASTNISGSIDLVVDVGEPLYRMVELKSMDKDLHRKLVAPLAEHNFRTSLYLRLIAESDLPEAKLINTDVAHIIYVSKSYGFADTTIAEAGIKDSAFSPFKEYKIKRNDSLTELQVAKAKTLARFKETKQVPAGICPNGLCGRAQKCPVMSQCFSGSYPAKTTWLVNGNPAHSGKEVVV